MGFNRFQGILSYFKIVQGIPRDFMGFQGISMESKKFLRDFKVFQRIPKDFKGFLGTSTDFTEFQQISWDNMGFHRIFKEFHSEVQIYQV